MLSDKNCEKARRSRDPRFDGLFFAGVTSTGIYCRPICPAPPQKPENVIYFPTASAAVNASLSMDDLLKGVIEANGGMRLPGAWDPFEVVTRAVVGQQISVKGARTILGRIAEKAGKPAGKLAAGKLNMFFPDAKAVSGANFIDLGMPQKRIDTLKRVASAVQSGRVQFEAGRKTAEFIDEISQIKGIGPWTANYIAMRAFGEPDAFIAQDLGIINALTPKGGNRPTAIQIEKRAENWRPWRAYAAVYLWHTR